MEADTKRVIVSGASSFFITSLLLFVYKLVFPMNDLSTAVCVLAALMGIASGVVIGFAIYK